MRLIIIFLLTTQFAFTQIYEVGLSLGGSNFIGDVGDTSFISPDEVLDSEGKINGLITYGLLLKWNRSPRHSYRVSVLSSHLIGNDLDSKDPRRIERELMFESDLFEISGGVEFTFLNFNLHDYGRKYTPYIFTGLVYAQYDKLAYQNNTILKLKGKSNSYGIPFVLGFKYRVLEQFIISAEVGSRFMFTDNIDASLSNEGDYTNFGNINNKDWYIFSLINLSYTFGRKPCYCNY